MKIFEYKIEGMSLNQTEEMSYLNNMSHLGWRFVSIIVFPNEQSLKFPATYRSMCYKQYYFEREKDE